MNKYYIYSALLIIVINSIFCNKKNDNEISNDRTYIISLNAPTNWGKMIKSSSGKLIYYNYSKGALIGKIILNGLLPSHDYALSLYGKPPFPGNDKLPDSYGVERYFDFLTVKTNLNGDIDSTDFEAELPPGDYNIKFFVKDIEDWNVVLYNDNLRFTVK